MSMKLLYTRPIHTVKRVEFHNERVMGEAHRSLVHSIRPQYDSLQDLGQELLPNSSIFKVERNYKIDNLSYVKFCQEFNFEDKNAHAIFV